MSASAPSLVQVQKPSVASEATDGRLMRAAAGAAGRRQKDTMRTFLPGGAAPSSPPLLPPRSRMQRPISLPVGRSAPALPGVLEPDSGATRTRQQQFKRRNRRFKLGQLDSFSQSQRRLASHSKGLLKEQVQLLQLNASTCE